MQPCKALFLFVPAVLCIFRKKVLFLLIRKPLAMDVNYQELVERQRDELFAHVALSHTPADVEKIKEAYYFAEKAHANQKRKDGEPYITHPIAVAKIINDDLALGTNPVIAGLLHDVVEDTPYTIEDIQSRFGDDVAFLVGVVTKTVKTDYVTSKQVDNFDQMLSSIHYDIRALLVKLADRLHNMRTLKSMKEEKQVKIASETDFFYAPLANRLGLYRIKTELENLSLRYRSPHEYYHVENQINEYVAQHTAATEKWMEPIRRVLAEHGIEATVTCDPRSIYSIWSKKQRDNLAFKELEHIRVVHVTFSNWRELGNTEKNQALIIYSLLTDLYTEKPFSVNNYIDMPKDNGYRSLHCKLMGNEGRWMEVHIQSKEMQMMSTYGCLMERESGVDAWIKKFRSILKDIATHSREGGYMDDVVSSFYDDDVVVFAADGSKVSLPKDSTAIDFAFEVDAEQAMQAKYAIINDKLSSIKTVLQRGDRVRIGIDDDGGPKPEWMDFVKTYKARNLIRQYLQEHLKDEADNKYVLCEDCKPLPGDEVVGFKQPDGKIRVHKCNCRSSISLSAQQGENIVSVDLSCFKTRKFPCGFHIKGVNRNGFLYDLMTELSKNLGLSIESIASYTNDEIIDCTVNLYVHSIDEWHFVLDHIREMKNIYEVRSL